MKVNAINPATEETIGEWEVSDNSAVKGAVKKAQSAFRLGPGPIYLRESASWARLPWNLRKTRVNSLP